MNDTLCADCVDQLTAFQLGLLPETEGGVLREHLGSCPNCRIFSEQIDQTAALLEAFPQPDAPPELALAIASSSPSSSGTDADALLRQLCQLADSFDQRNAEDLVQSTFLAAVERNPADLEIADLARDLADAALADGQPETRELDQFDLATTTSMLDPDGDTAELFYPDFYSEGPDIGRFVDSPAVWGRTNVLTPEEDFTTTELYGVVDQALDQLPAPSGQLIQLVDIDQLSLPKAAAALRLSVPDAASALHQARVHVRGAINDFAT
ncbi:MAG: zf-HC2 domain-containing protein [Acidimicrobiales bacterium]